MPWFRPLEPQGEQDGNGGMHLTFRNDRVNRAPVVGQQSQSWRPDSGTVTATILYTGPANTAMVFVRDVLTSYGHTVRTACDWAHAQHFLSISPPDLLLLNPDLVGLDAAAALMSFAGSAAKAVVVISANHADEHVVATLKHGADDHIALPLQATVLAARVQAILRRVLTSMEAPEIPHIAFSLPGAVFNPASYDVVRADGGRVVLTRTQADVLEVLLRHRGQVLSPDRLLTAVQGYASEAQANVIKSHIQYLREKLRLVCGDVEVIQTVPGVGYSVTQWGDMLSSRPSRPTGRPLSPRSS